MKKIAFVFVAAIAASVAVSFSSCGEGQKATDSVADSTVVEEPACCDSAACCDSTAADSTVADSAVVAEPAA